MKKLYLFLLLLFVSVCAQAQNVFMNNGALVHVQAGALLHVQGGIVNQGATGSITNLGTISAMDGAAAGASFTAAGGAAVGFKGDVNNQTTAALNLNNASILNVQNDFTNDATITATSGSITNFIGIDGAQIYRRNVNANAADDFGNVNVNMTTVTPGTITLTAGTAANSNFKVQNGSILTFMNSGVFVTGATFEVNVKNPAPAAIVGHVTYTNDKFVSTRLRRAFNATSVGNMDFPVGSFNSHGHNMIRFVPASVTSNGDVLISYLDPSGAHQISLSVLIL
jgi:hypothetical protein